MLEAMSVRPSPSVVYQLSVSFRPISAEGVVVPGQHCQRAGSAQPLSIVRARQHVERESGTLPLQLARPGVDGSPIWVARGCLQVDAEQSLTLERERELATVASHAKFS